MFSYSHFRAELLSVAVLGYKSCSHCKKMAIFLHDTRSHVKKIEISLHEKTHHVKKSAFFLHDKAADALTIYHILNI